jgi:hypothetical protein
MTAVSSLIITNDNSVQSTTTTMTGKSSVIPVYALTTNLNCYGRIQKSQTSGHQVHASRTA